MTILVPVDFAQNTPNIVRYAHALASATGETLALMHVIDFTADDNGWRVLFSAPDELEVEARERAKEKLEELFDELIGTDETFETVVQFGEPAETILAETRRDDIALVVLGTVGQSRLQEIFFGHTPSRLVREAEIPVVAVPPEFERVAIDRILAPVDFSDTSRASLAYAASIAKSQNAGLEILNAFEPPSPPPFLGLPGVEHADRIDEIKSSRMESLSEFVEAVGVVDEVTEQWVVASKPADAINQIGAEREIDLVVMGTAGRSGLERFFLGSTAERVLRQTKRPVMVLKGTGS